MKEKIFLILATITLLFSYSVAKKNPMGQEIKQKNLAQKKHKNYKYTIDKRIENAIESGLITKEQGDALLAQKKELENYKITIWQDDVMTKEEKDTLDTMHKNFKEKIHIVLETAMKKWQRKQQNNNYFHFVVQNALNNGKITKKQADILTKKITDLEKLETQIWADNKMTKQEYEKLQQTKIALKQDMKKLFQKPKDKMKKFKHR